MHVCLHRTAALLLALSSLLLIGHATAQCGGSAAGKCTIAVPTQGSRCGWSTAYYCGGGTLFNFTGSPPCTWYISNSSYGYTGSVGPFTDSNCTITGANYAPPFPTTLSPPANGAFAARLPMGLLMAIMAAALGFAAPMMMMMPLL